MKINRRDFFKFTGGAVTGAAISGVGVQTVSKIVHAIEEPEFPATGPERWVPSICQQCHGGCGILVRIIGDRAVKIEGNPLYPVNRGTLCPRGQAGLQVLYDPDRIKGPMKRTGQRGSGPWQEIGWDEALSIVSNKLLELRKEGNPHTLAIVSGDSNGLMATLIKRFLDAFGSPNFLRASNDSGETEVVTMLTHGISHPLGYDLEKANYILSFGSGFIEGWGSPVRTMRAYGVLRQGRTTGRAKIVQIESRLSTTGAKSDEWVPVHPNTEGAFALGLAYVIISERLYNREFVERHTHGFEDWTDEEGRAHTGFKNLVLKEYSLNTVSKITGVPVETILKLGREFATTRKSLAILGHGGNVNYTKLYDDMAIHSLNALVGSIDTEGGVIIQRDVPLSELPEVKRDEISEKGREMARIDGARTEKFPFAASLTHNLSDAIMNDKPYPVKALFIYRSNPLFIIPEPPGEFEEALNKVPFIVSFSSFMDDTTSLVSDLVLPDHTYLERWQEDLGSPTLEFSVCGLRQPVVKPLYRTMHTGDVIISIAKRLGGSVGDSFPWDNFEEVLKERLKGLYEAKRGSIIGTAFEEKWGKMLERVGWWSPTYRSFEELWKQLVEKGGWWDPFYYYGDWDRMFQTPSKKFEFYSQVLSKKLEELAGEGSADESREKLLTQWGVEARGDKVFLPHYEPVNGTGDEKAYPLFLYPYEPLALLGGDGANQPFLQEIVGGHVLEEWGSWVEINPETAKELGISNGDMVKVCGASPKGSLVLKAKLYPGAMPHVVNVPVGLGHEAYGRWARGIGVNVHRIIVKRVDPLSGKLNWAATRVRIEKVYS